LAGLLSVDLLSLAGSSLQGASERSEGVSEAMHQPADASALYTRLIERHFGAT
jgi:hypothetical protein